MGQAVHGGVGHPNLELPLTEIHLSTSLSQPKQNMQARSHRFKNSGTTWQIRSGQGGLPCSTWHLWKVTHHTSFVSIDKHKTNPLEVLFVYRSEAESDRRKSKRRPLCSTINQRLGAEVIKQQVQRCAVVHGVHSGNSCNTWIVFGALPGIPATGSSRIASHVARHSNSQLKAPLRRLHL